MDLKGQIIKIFPKKQVSEKFAKREFVIETGDKYPQKILVQLTQDRCELIDRFAEGEEVTAHINLRGRDWTSKEGEIKYFNTIEAWKLENESANNYNPQNGHFSTQEAKVAVSAPDLNESDDLPF
jgi:hypothetical protein